MADEETQLDANEIINSLANRNAQANRDIAVLEATTSALRRELAQVRQENDRLQAALVEMQGEDQGQEPLGPEPKDPE